MLEGTIQDCSNGQCFSTFTFLETTAATSAFFDALDTNHDGRVDEAVAASFLSDQRVAPSRAHIDRMVATVVEAAFNEVLVNLDTGMDGPSLPATVPVQTR
jgi:hypothetical protein